MLARQLRLIWLLSPPQAAPARSRIAAAAADQAAKATCARIDPALPSDELV